MSLFDPNNREKYSHLPKGPEEEEDFDEGFQVLDPMNCPICEKKVEDVFSIEAEKPFTAMSPMAGLTVWGPYDVQKKIICEGHSWVHFKFTHDDSERLVLMNLLEHLKTKYKEI